MKTYVIDLGSSSICVFKKDYGIILEEPSLVGMKNGLNGEIEYAVFGDNAKKALTEKRENLLVECPIENGAIKNLHAAIALTDHFLRLSEATGKFNLVFLIDPTLSVEEKNAFRDVGYASGAKKVKLVYSPIAALVGMGKDLSRSESVLALDIGGDKCTVSIVKGENIIVSNTILVGGKMIDAAIGTLLSRRIAFKVTAKQAEKLRLDIGSLLRKNFKQTAVSGIDLKSNTARKEVITSENIRETILYYFNQIASLIKYTLSQVSDDMASEIILDGVYVYGGLSHTEGIELLLTEILKMPAYIVENRNIISVLGAGRMLLRKNFF